MRAEAVPCSGNVFLTTAPRAHGSPRALCADHCCHPNPAPVLWIPHTWSCSLLPHWDRGAWTAQGVLKTSLPVTALARLLPAAHFRVL